MAGFWDGWYTAASSEAVLVLTAAMMLMGGYLLTRVTKRVGLPNVTAYILSGILIGPYGLRLVPAGLVDGTSFLPDVALAFIAFSSGEFFRLDRLRKNGGKVVLITVMESCAAAVLVFGLTYGILRLSLPFSLVLSALATATAPASTMMTIRQTRARGDFVDTLLQVVALDDVVGLVLYSVAVAAASAYLSGNGIDLQLVAAPLLRTLAAMALGGLFGFLLVLFHISRHSADNRLIIAVALLLGYCGVCAVLDVSPLLGCMAMGMTYVNATRDEDLFCQLNQFSPPILLLFFVRSGISFDLRSLIGHSQTVGDVPLLLIGILYFFVRILGKYLGAFAGCQMAGKSANVRDYLGLALIPQAGVAIGLAALGARTIGGEAGNALETVILSSSVLYELIGPAAAKMALRLSGACGGTEAPPCPPRARLKARHSS